MKLLLPVIALLFMATVLPAQNITYRYDAAGNRTERVITLRSELKSPSETSLATSIDDIVAEYGLKIYPNPTRGLLTVEISNYSAGLQAEFRLLDMSGRVISRQAPGSGSVSFDLGGHPPGIYLLAISINSEQTTWKIVKE